MQCSTRSIRIEQIDLSSAASTAAAPERIVSEPQVVSLLFPPQVPACGSRIGTPNFDDLGITSIVRALDIDQRHSRFIAGILGTLEQNPITLHYRQAALAELLAHPTFVEQLAAILPSLYALAEAGPTARWQDNAPLPLVGMRLADLQNYVTVVEQLWNTLDTAAPPLCAQAWLELRAMLGDMRRDDEYTHLVEHLPQLRAQLEQAASVTIGINLDGQLQPESATVLAVNPYRFNAKSSIVERLIGDRHTADAVRGITALYKASEGDQRTPEHVLFRDMNRLLERVAAPVAAILGRYVRISTTPLTALTGEIVFYIGAARLWQRLIVQQLPCCLPIIVPVSERACTITETYSLDLVLRTQAADQIVTNNVLFEPDTPILMITGPNSGGKTTYGRAIAQAQVMFQAGLFVAAGAAWLSPVDGIFSHFATVERPGGSGGRLAEELERIAHIFATATGNSLLIFNEPLSSTDEHSARLLARDIIGGVQLLRARTVFITHIYQLVDELIPSGEQAPGLVSLIAMMLPQRDGALTETPAYRIVYGRPRVSEYAHELAQRYGLSLDQLERALGKRLTASAPDPGVGDPTSWNA